MVVASAVLVAILMRDGVGMPMKMPRQVRVLATGPGVDHLSEELNHQVGGDQGVTAKSSHELKRDTSKGRRVRASYSSHQKAKSSTLSSTLNAEKPDCLTHQVIAVGCLLQPPPLFPRAKAIPMKAIRWTVWQVLAIVFGLTGLSAARAQDASQKTPVIPAVNEAVRQHIDAGQYAGAVTLFAQDGKIVHLGAVGQADLKSRRPMTTDTVFAIASMTKPITATGLMILVEEGKVNLDDPVSKYTPEFADVKFDGKPLEKPVTVRQCLTHTAGLSGSQRNVESLENSAKVIASRPLQYEPGTKWSYSPGITVAGRVLEVAAGQPYDEFLKERIFTPLKMTHTTFLPTSQQQANRATLYALDKESGKLEPAESWIGDFETDPSPNPSAGLFSTAGDLFRFYQMVLNGGYLEDAKILKRESVQEMTRLQTGDLTTGFTPGNGWALGWCVVREPQGVSEALSPGSFGHGGAFGTQGWVDPKQNRIFVLLTQRSNIPNSDASDLRRDFQNTAVASKRN